MAGTWLAKPAIGDRRQLSGGETHPTFTWYLKTRPHNRIQAQPHRRHGLVGVADERFRLAAKPSAKLCRFHTCPPGGLVDRDLRPVDLDAQGMVTWDPEGEEFASATYYGDPRLTSKVAPETDFVGSGTMGAGIAIVSARAGFRTVVYDTREEALARARKQTEGFFAKSVERKKLSQEQVGRIMASLAGTTDIGALAACDIVIEAGMAKVAGTDRALPLTTVARAAYHQAHRFGGDTSPGVRESATYDPSGTFSNACHAAIVEVDVALHDRNAPLIQILVLQADLARV